MMSKESFTKRTKAEQPMVTKSNINIIKREIIIEPKRGGRNKSGSAQKSYFSQERIYSM